MKIRSLIGPKSSSLSWNNQTAYEMKQSTVMAKLFAIRSEFSQAVSWIDQIPLEKWAQAFDGGKRFGHMTTNLAKCTNFVLRGAWSLPISALVKTTFETIKDWFFNEAQRLTACYEHVIYIQKILLPLYGKMNNNLLCACWKIWPLKLWVWCQEDGHSPMMPTYVFHI